jgi:hypothetical protein
MPTTPQQQFVESQQHGSFHRPQQEADLFLSKHPELDGSDNELN